MKVSVKKVKKTWGYELWLANNEEHNYCGKILHINKGHKSSIHYHEKKHETMYVLNGKLKLTLFEECPLGTGDPETMLIGSTQELEAGESIEIKQLIPHQLIAAEDVDVIESSTFHMDSDSKRKGVDWE
jgi:oxalate decarboxylase/phosphoglucose isomerase-like protein (cupin superfamily)